MASTPTHGPLASLVLTAGPRYGEELPVPSPVVTIGRAAGSDVVIDDDSVSAEHARLEFDLGAWRITDLGSTNGTAVEGVKLAPNVPTPLPYGTTVRFGGVRLQFREVDAADPGAARAAYVAPAAPVTLAEERRRLRLPVWLVLLALLVLAVLGWAIWSLSQDGPVPTGPAAGAPAVQAPPAPAAATP
jgi:hypothetical protein